MNSLEKYRDEIDCLDSELIELLEKRFDICVKIGKYKKDNDMPVLNENREKEVISKNLLKVTNDNFKLHIENILNSIMCESKEIQKKL